MIPQEELDRALRRWKARKLGQDVPQVIGEDIQMESSHLHDEPTRVASSNYPSEVQTPPAEVTLSETDFEDHTHHKTRSSAPGSGAARPSQYSRWGWGWAPAGACAECCALAPARLGSVRRPFSSRAQVGRRPVAVHVEREGGNSPKPPAGWSSRSPRTALFPERTPHAR